MKKTFYTLGFPSSLFLSALAPQALALEIKPHMFMAFEGGGGTLLEVEYDDGSSARIHAGEGFYIAGGAELWLNHDGSFRSTLTIGHKQATTQEASNGDATFTRLPIDGLLFFRTSEHVVGVGATYHLSPDLDGKGVLRNYSASFDDALGFIFQYSYALGPNGSVGIRRTDISYTLSGTEYSVDGSSWGIFLNASF